jgi:hypothetical protein
MTQIEIISISGVTFPYELYACDVYGNQCVLVGTGDTPSPPSVIFTLPSQFDTAPAIGILMIDAINCERFYIGYCQVGNKLYQDYINFQFMDFIIYRFEDQ